MKVVEVLAGQTKADFRDRVALLENVKENFVWKTGKSLLASESTNHIQQ